MAGASRTFRIFVSSTFSDLKAERNALQERVFPKLRQLCMQHGARFQGGAVSGGLVMYGPGPTSRLRTCGCRRTAANGSIGPWSAEVAHD